MFNCFSTFIELSIEKTMLASFHKAKETKPVPHPKSATAYPYIYF